MSEHHLDKIVDEAARDYHYYWKPKPGESGLKTIIRRACERYAARKEGDAPCRNGQTPTPVSDAAPTSDPAAAANAAEKEWHEAAMGADVRHQE